MKNKTLKHILIAAIAGAALVTIVDAQERDKPRGGRQIGGHSGQSNFGAPNSLRDGNGDRDGNANRQTVRKPSGGRERDGDNARKPKPGQGRKPGTGMGRSDRQKPKPKPNLREVLDLTDEQAKALHAARKKWNGYAKSIHENKELSKEDKQAKLKKGHKRLDAKMREILSEEQYAQLRDLRRRNAKPGNREEQAGNQNEQRRKPNGAEQRKRIAQALKLTDDQKKKLRAVHEHVVKKIRAIHANKELSKEEKQAEIQAIHKTAHARRKEILTDEQKASLRAQRENNTQPVNNQQGRPQRGGGNEQGRPQRRPQQGGGNRKKGRPQQGGGNRQQGGAF